VIALRGLFGHGGAAQDMAVRADRP
jgi:hypothetical protein